ncbi:matrix metalloproteinase-19-like [Saccoglossus kowalevskii]|uniref:Matrix metalloproteinase-19-like n=1 Tax=Saccoglossus kowalevskii TaxID=10224 RepID=A0ABM0LWV6_SACKO|nr:PREDICTED: matrix metalloproteinase-19-like [Saccoglossus kowalevskii]
MSRRFKQNTLPGHSFSDKDALCYFKELSDHLLYLINNDDDENFASHYSVLGEVLCYSQAYGNYGKLWRDTFYHCHPGKPLEECLAMALRLPPMGVYILERVAHCYQFSDKKDEAIKLYENSKWDKRDLTYEYLSYTNDVSKDDQRNAISRAFKRWSDVTPLTFTEVTDGGADISLDFVVGDHGDGDANAFNRKGEVMAHAYPPGNGDIHFNDLENFAVDSGTADGIDLEWVATHEIGHSLGLGHSEYHKSVMHSKYPGYISNLQLTRDDVNGIQAIYGKNKYYVPMFPSHSSQAPDICKCSFDAIITANVYKDTYVIKKRHIWKLNEHGVVDTYPRKLSETYNYLPGNIDTGFTSYWSNRTYFFRGDQYWRYYGYILEPGYPKSTNATGIPRRPDAALVWPGDASYLIYFFKGPRYYIWSEYDETIIPGGVGLISDRWSGLPKHFDTAFSRDGDTFFVKRDKYWLVKNGDLKVSEGYPRSTSDDWLNCV